MSNEISITFLGTSDQIPSAKRNHTSILISYTNENILIDCGEGTQRQFRIAKINLCKLTKILITHWHGDHVLGLPGLLQTLALNGYNKTLEIYGPKKTKKFVEEMLALFNFQREYTIKVFEIDSGVFFDSKEFYLEAKSVYHGIPCNAYNLLKRTIKNK
jgi:ribonuclease Z